MQKTSILLHILAVGLLLISMRATANVTENNKNILWYLRPASYWEEALPLGNGRLGVMHSGGIAVDTLQLNEDTFWDCGPNRNYNPNALGVLKQVRDSIFAHRYAAVQDLAVSNFNSPTSQGAAYRAGGVLLIGFPGQQFNNREEGRTANAKDARGYKRMLDMNTATSTVTYNVGGTTYKRTVFTSFADNVVIIRLEASRRGMLDFTLAYTGCNKTNGEVLTSNQLYDSRTIKATMGPAERQTEHVDNKLNLCTMIRIADCDGKITSSTVNIASHGTAGEAANAPQLMVKGATSATIVVSQATNFKHYDDVSGDAFASALSFLDDFIAKKKDFRTALADHVATYSRQFARVDLDLGHNKDQELKDTEERIRDFHTTIDPQLAALYFQFGRYLLISSSQPGTEPANLQGIWNPDARQYPAWDSKYTTNINVEMNYWPAEVTNLPECHEPFIQLVKDVSITGAETARKMYGARGWTLHHNTDIWRTTGPVDRLTVSIWPTANAWLCQHLWERYLYSGDRQYLASVYPVMKGASEFYQDFLVEDPNTHYMVVCPSNSPENNPGIGKYKDSNGKDRAIGLFGGIAMDNEMVYDLLRSTALAARTLGTDTAFADSLDALKARLTPWRIGKYGQVQEWQEDWDRETTSHRHLSHLWGLPGLTGVAVQHPHPLPGCPQEPCRTRRRGTRMVDGMEGSPLGAHARRRPCSENPQEPAHPSQPQRYHQKLRRRLLCQHVRCPPTIPDRRQLRSHGCNRRDADTVARRIHVCPAGTADRMEACRRIERIALARSIRHRGPQVEGRQGGGTENKVNHRRKPAPALCNSIVLRRRHSPEPCQWRQPQSTDAAIQHAGAHSEGQEQDTRDCPARDLPV